MATIANAGTEPSWYPIDLTAGSNGLGLNSTLWCATFRHQFTGNGNPGQSREKNQVYWKGIKEKITVRTDTNAPVRWRRIVFENPVLPDMTNVPPGSYVAYTALPEKGRSPMIMTRALRMPITALLRVRASRRGLLSKI